jgi:hypothetical protein
MEVMVVDQMISVDLVGRGDGCGFVDTEKL